MVRCVCRSPETGEPSKTRNLYLLLLAYSCVGTRTFLSASALRANHAQAFSQPWKYQNAVCVQARMRARVPAFRLSNYFAFDHVLAVYRFTHRRGGAG